MAIVFARLLAMFIVLSPAWASNAKGVAFLEEKEKEDGVFATGSGLLYKVLRKGQGKASPLAGTSCECHYEGTLIDGTKFDSSYDRGEPTSFAPNQVSKRRNEIGGTNATHAQLYGNGLCMAMALLGVPFHPTFTEICAGDQGLD